MKYEPFGWHHWADHFFLSYQFRRALGETQEGGGAVSGLGEKFTPDLFTGTGNLSIPIQVPAGRLGLQPQLALAYSTGTGNGCSGAKR